MAERKRKASDRVVRPSERAFRASGGQPPAVEPASEVLVIESGSGWDTKIAHGVERVGVKSPPLRGQRPAKWPDGRRSVRTQAPVLAQPEVNADVSQAGPAEEGPFSDGNRGGTRHVITEGFPVGADVSKVFSSAPQGRPGTAPSRIAGTFVRTLGAVRKEPSERQGELLSPWSVPSVEESLLFEGIYAEVPRGESGRALSATKMLQSDGLAVMTWQRPEPRQGGWVGGSESEIAQSDVRTGVEKFSPIRPRVKRNGKPVRGLVKKVSVPKKASFASDFDADTESLTPDSVVDAASEPDRLRRRLARKRRAAKWPQGEGWEREVLAKAETDRRLDVLKGMAARIAKRLEALAFSGGEGSRAELAPEIEAIVGQAEKLLRGVDARGRTGGDDPPGKARTPKKRKARKRGLSMGRALGGLGSPLAGKRLSTSPERSGVRFKRDTIEASADKGPKTSAEDRRPASGVADVAVTSQQSLSDDASLFSPMERSQSALSVGVNSDGALRIGPNVQTAGGFSHPFAETSVLASAVTTQGSEQERAAGSAADESVASDVGGGDDVIADLDAEIQQLLQSRRLDPAARVGTGSESLKGSAGPAGSRIGVGESSAEQRWAALVGPGERSDSEGSEEETGEESSAEEKSRRVAPLAHVSKSPRGLVPGARPPSADVSRGAQGFPIGGGLLSDLYSDSEEEEESDSGPSRSADRLTSQTRAGSEEQAWASRKRVEQVSNVDVTRVSADVSTEPKKITVKQLLESSGDALLDEAVPARVPPLLERTPAETKGDRLSIVHLYEKQLRERMERQQRQLAELERKRKEDERNEAERNARAERDATAERDERAERVARAEREANAEVAGERWGLAGEEKDGIPAAVRRNEEERKEEERKRSEQHLNEENWKEQEERNLKEERKREEEERNEMEPKRKEAENREAVRQPVVDVAPGQQAVIAPENLVPAGNVPVAFTEGIPPSESRPKGISAKVVELTAKPIAESDDPERGLLVPVKVTGKGWPVKARDGKQTARQKETAIASADGGHVARQDVLEFFPGAKGGLETGRKELLSRATHLVETERRLSPEMLEQM